jgi:hypothetical protein
MKALQAAVALAGGQSTRGREQSTAIYQNLGGSKRRTVFLDKDGRIVFAVRTFKWGTIKTYTFKAMPMGLSEDIKVYLLFIRPLELAICQATSFFNMQDNADPLPKYKLFHYFAHQLTTQAFSRTMDKFADEFMKVKRSAGSPTVSQLLIRHLIVHIGRVYLVPAMDRKRLLQFMDKTANHTPRTAITSYAVTVGQNEGEYDQAVWTRDLEISILHHEFYGLADSPPQLSSQDVHPVDANQAAPRMLCDCPGYR